MESVIDLRQIRITPQIEDAVKKYNTIVDLSQFKKNTHNFTTPLNRMESMMTAEEDIVKNLPVKLVNVKRNGKNVGINIDGTKKALYDIIDGRHRITRSIVNDKKHIKAKIASSGGRKHVLNTRKRKGKYRNIRKHKTTKRRLAKTVKN